MRRARFLVGGKSWLLGVFWALTSLTAVAAPEPAGYWTGDINAPVPATIRGGKVIHARQLSKMLQARHVVVVDVSNAPRRPENLATGAPWLPPAHPGIPAALWLPGTGLGNPPDAVDTFFRAQLAEATHMDFSQPIAIYCHERCWLSWNAAKRAISYGYRHVMWMPEGIEGWRAAGLTTVDLQPLGP